MPIYEYQCGDCGDKSEIIVRITAQDDTLQGKHCGSTELNKIPTAAASVTH